MRNQSWAIALSALVVVVAATAHGAEVSERSGGDGAAEVRRHELGFGVLAGTGYELVLPGRLVAWSRECSRETRSDGVLEPCGVYVLSQRQRGEEAEDPTIRRRDRPELYGVYLFRPGSEMPLRRLGSYEAPRIATIRAFDLDGDGRGEPLISEDGNLYRVHDDGRLEPLLEDEPDRLHLESAVEVEGPDGPLLAVAGVGVLRLFRGTDGLLVEQEEIALPVQVDRRRGGLSLRSPRLRPVEGSMEWLAVGPEAQGAVRLRTLLLPVDPEHREPPREDDDERPGPWQEAWSRLPGPERVEGAHYELTDDGIALLVHTLRSDRVGILEKKKVRVFLLHGDRTREGEGPRFEGFTVSRLWQPLGSTLDDVDGDGVLDLLLFQHEGFDGDHLLAEVYPGEGVAGSSVPSGFSDKSWRSKLDVESARWFWGHDLTGDGRGDLLLWSGGLMLFPTLESPKKKGFLESDPVAELWPPQPAGADPFEVEMVIDLPGDGEDQAIEESDERFDEDRPSHEQEAEEPDPRVRWRSPSLDLDGSGGAEIVVPGRSDGGDRLLLVRLGAEVEG